MSKIEWDDMNTRDYRAGISHGVLYTLSGNVYTNGVPWNGLISISDKPSRQQKDPLFIGDMIQGYALSIEEYAGEIKAVMYPDAFIPCLGYSSLVKGVYFTQQEPVMFGLSYFVHTGLIPSGDETHGELHLIYNAIVTDSVSFTHETIGGGKAIEEMSIPFDTMAMENGRFTPTSHIVIDRPKISASRRNNFDTLLRTLHGTETTKPQLPLPSDIINLFSVDNPATVITPSPMRTSTRSGWYETDGPLE